MPYERGEQRHSARLTESDVRNIRKAYDAEPHPSMKALAAKYGVSAVNIHHIVHGKRWKHVQ